MENIRGNVGTAFFIRHVYSYQLCNIEDDTVIVYYTLSAAEKWPSEQETKLLDSDKIKRPSTKWVFVSFFNVDVKVVLDRQQRLVVPDHQQALLGTGPLPKQPLFCTGPYQTGCATLHMAGRWWRWIPIKITCVYGVVLLRTEERVLIEAQQQPTVSQGVSSNSKLCQPTAQNKVERHLNQGASFSDWLGIRVYEPEHLEDAEVVWHLRRNPPAQLKNILTVGIFWRGRVRHQGYIHTYKFY